MIGTTFLLFAALALGLIGTFALIFTLVAAFKKRKNHLLVGLLMLGVCTPLFIWTLISISSYTEENTLGLLNNSQYEYIAPPIDFSENANNEGIGDSLGFSDEPQWNLQEVWFGDSIKNLSNSKWIDRIPADFYHDFGDSTHYRFPLVYPYQIICDETPQSGRLECSTPILFSVKVNFPTITHLAFDSKHLFLKWMEKGTPKYSSFNWETGATTSFDFEQELIDHAVSLGFQGELKLISLNDYWDQF